MGEGGATNQQQQQEEEGFHGESRLFRDLEQFVHRHFIVDFFQVILVLQGRIGSQQGREHGFFGFGGLLENGFFEPQLSCVLPGQGKILQP